MESQCIIDPDGANDTSTSGSSGPVYYQTENNSHSTCYLCGRLSYLIVSHHSTYNKPQLDEAEL